MKDITLLLFIISISTLSFTQDQMYQICPIKIGAETPSTTLIDKANVSITLPDLVKNKPSVLIFYRGAWCRYCTKHLAALNDIKMEVENLGYQMIGITVDKYDKLPESNKKSESDIDVYSDSNLETITAFGLDWKVDDVLLNKYKNEYKIDLEEWSGQYHHALPVPAIFIIRENTVVFQYVDPNYRSRIGPETLLAVLKTL